MAKKINIKATSVKNANSKLPFCTSKAASVKNGIQSVRSNVQPCVKARCNISDSLNNAYKDAARIEASIQELYRTVNRCVDFYVSADDRVKASAKKVSNWK